MKNILSFIFLFSATAAWTQQVNTYQCVYNEQAKFLIKYDLEKNWAQIQELDMQGNILSTQIADKGVEEQTAIIGEKEGSTYSLTFVSASITSEITIDPLYIKGEVYPLFELSVLKSSNECKDCQPTEIEISLSKYYPRQGKSDAPYIFTNLTNCTRL